MFRCRIRRHPTYNNYLAHDDDEDKQDGEYLVHLLYLHQERTNRQTYTTPTGISFAQNCDILIYLTSLIYLDLKKLIACIGIGTGIAIVAWHRHHHHAAAVGSAGRRRGVEEQPKLSENHISSQYVGWLTACTRHAMAHPAARCIVQRADEGHHKM